MTAHRVRTRSSLAGFCSAIGLAILAAPAFGFGSDVARAQDTEIVKADSLIDAVDPGVKLFLGEKMAAGNWAIADAGASCRRGSATT